jgi:hypothetical protein
MGVVSMISTSMRSAEISFLTPNPLNPLAAGEET